MLNEIWHLVKKDLKLEWRQPFTLSGIFLYVASTVFVVYMAFREIEPRAWNTMFWIILLFASVNAAAKSFIQENSERYYYYYTLARPESFILAKIIYNILILMVMSVLAFVIYSILLKNPLVNPKMFWLAVVLGTFSFAISFTLIAAIAAKAGNSALLMPILSFPVIIPIIALLIQISESAFFTSVDANLTNKVLSLVAVDVIALALSFLLFPYIWRD